MNGITSRKFIRVGSAFPLRKSRDDLQKFGSEMPESENANMKARTITRRRDGRSKTGSRSHNRSL